jgi:hypothetical protein
LGSQQNQNNQEGCAWHQSSLAKPLKDTAAGPPGPRALAGEGQQDLPGLRALAGNPQQDLPRPEGFGRYWRGKKIKTRFQFTGVSKSLPSPACFRMGVVVFGWLITFAMRRLQNSVVVNCIRPVTFYCIFIYFESLIVCLLLLRTLEAMHMGHSWDAVIV